MDPIFDLSIEKVLSHETDSELTVEQYIATCRGMWVEHGFSKIDVPDIAAAAFDMCFIIGKESAIRLLQMAVNEFAPHRLTVDGLIGQKTSKAVNDHYHPDYLLARYQLLAVGYFLRVDDNAKAVEGIKRILS